jgi:outer membrane lipoprotein-sorting protein
MLLLCPGPGPARGAAVPDAETLLTQMKEAWSQVKDYKATVEVRTRKAGGLFEVRKFLYTFKKPGCIRLDFESPHRGMILIFPDEEGKVLLRPSGIARLFRFHLAKDSPLLVGASGQRIDQTDLGQLIHNIGHSLTDGCLGPAAITREGKRVQIRVLAVDHFRSNVATLYRFFLDEDLHLPVEVEESTPGGLLERRVTFGDLQLNGEVPDSLFRPVGGPCAGGADEN